MEPDEEATQPSLYFASTQIQSRYEDEQEIENSLRDLKRFRKSSPNEHKIIEMAMKAPRKKASKPRTKPKKKAQSALSLNAFVKDTFGSRNKPDPQSIVDYFAGDINKVNDFLGKIDAVYGDSSNSSQSVTSLQRDEWEAFLSSIRLKFPNLPARSRKTLSRVSQRLKALQQSFTEASQGGDSIWSQASRQPSDELTPEDMKWLYDLEDGEEGETSLDQSSLKANSQSHDAKPFYLTLSQAMNDSRISDEEDSTDIELPSRNGPESPVLIHDSESEPEPYEAINSSGPGEEIPSRQEAGPPESCDILTSIAFKPKKKEESALGTQTQPLLIDEDHTTSPSKNNESVIFSSPVKLVQPFKPKTPTRWPSNLVITSSPVSSEKGTPARKRNESEDDLFATARSVLDEGDLASQSHLNKSSLPPAKRTSTKKRSFRTSTIEFRGHINISQDASNDVKIRKISVEKDDDEVKDSEDSECEVSLIEVSRPSDPIEPPLLTRMPSVLQVPSSPRKNTQSQSASKLMSISMKDMRDIYSHLGLAPTKLKATLAETIEYAIELTGMSIADFLDTEDYAEKSRKLGMLFMEMVYDKITMSIKSSEDLHMQIALFEPIFLDTLAQHLSENDVFPISLDHQFLQKYCDAKGVSTTVKQA